MLMIKKFFNTFVILLVIYAFSYCAWVFSKPFILPPLVLENVIEIDIGYVNTAHETLDVYFADDVPRLVTHLVMRGILKS